MADEGELQTGNENQETETPATDNSPVEETETTPPGEETDKSQGPSSEDYKKGMFKAQATVKELKAENERLQAQVGNQAPSETATPSENDQALKLLGDLIDKRIAPLQSALDQRNDAEIVAEVMSQKYSQALEPEIKAEFKTLPSNLPFGERFRLARANAIANNIDKITKISEEAGVAKGYNNKEVKKTLGAVNTPSRVSEPGKTWQEKLENGERLTDDEYMTNREAILAFEKTQTKTI